jgi:hypothetical protein
MRKLDRHAPWVLAVAVLVGSTQINLEHPFSSCEIKGNISPNTGERIYHTPSQEHYFETVITPSKGERWFCTEDEARNAGWRKSKA